MTRITRRLTLAAASLLALSALALVFAAPAAADSPGARNCDPSAAFLGPNGIEALLVGSVPVPQPVAKRGGSIDDPGALGTCIADCGGGSSITCTGSSCSAIDRDCPTQRGQCSATGTLTQYCPTEFPPPPSCTAQCWDGSTVTCTGNRCIPKDSNCTSGVQGSCYGSDSGTLSCPACCEDQTSCEDKNNSPCSGFGSSDCVYSGGGCGICDCDGSNWSCLL